MITGVRYCFMSSNTFAIFARLRVGVYERVDAVPFKEGAVLLHFLLKIILGHLVDLGLRAGSAPELVRCRLT